MTSYGTAGGSPQQPAWRAAGGMPVLGRDRAHELAILVNDAAATGAAADDDDDEGTPFAQPGSGSYADALVRTLRGAGLIVDIAHIVIKGGVRKQLLLLNASRARLLAQANAIKKREYLDEAGMPDVPVLDRLADAVAYTAAQRVLLVHDAVAYAAEQQQQQQQEQQQHLRHSRNPLAHPSVELCFALHDEAVSRKMLRSIGAHVDLKELKGETAATLRRHRDSLHEAMVGTPTKDGGPGASTSSPAAKVLCRASATADAVRDIGAEGVASFYATLVLSDAKLSSIRAHYGDEVGFYFAFMSHFLWCLCWLAPLGLCLFSVEHAGVAMGTYRAAQLVFSGLLVLWGSTFTLLWRQRCVALRKLWRLREGAMPEVVRPEFEAEPGQSDPSFYSPVRRVLKLAASLPAFALLLFALFTFVGAVFYWEMWIIFSWGGCRETNHAAQVAAASTNSTWDAALGCATSADTKGLLGWSYELLPGLAEAILFALLLVAFQALAFAVTRWLNWRTEAHFERSYACMAVMCSFLGMFGWYFYLAFWYTPDYDVGLASALSVRQHIWKVCEDRHDSAYCIKEEVNYRLRLKMMADYMLTPFVVNQLLNMAFLVLVPTIVKQAVKKYEGGVKKGGCSFLCVNVMLPIFGGDCTNTVTELRAFEQDPATAAATAEEGGGRGGGKGGAKGATPPAAASASPFELPAAQKIMDQSTMGKFEPFYEYEEIFLNFCFLIFFSAVFPLGPTFALVSNALETRSDFYKLAAVTTRPVPKAVNSIGVWDTFFPLAVELSAIVNAGLLFVSYAVLSYWGGASYHGKPLSTYWRDAFLFAFAFERLLKMLQMSLAALIGGRGHLVEHEIAKEHTQFKLHKIAALEEEARSKSQ
jgi:hypothetical protein